MEKKEKPMVVVIQEGCVSPALVSLTISADKNGMGRMDVFVNKEWLEIMDEMYPGFTDDFMKVYNEDFRSLQRKLDKLFGKYEKVYAEKVGGLKR